MRHKKDFKRLGRPTDQRVALLRSQVRALLWHNRIKTTVEKAHETSRMAEKIITLAKRGDLAARRQVLRDVPDAKLVRHIFDEIAPRYATRPGGYTRIVHAGMRRGDSAEMAILELCD